MTGLGFGLLGDELLGGDAPDSGVDVAIVGVATATADLNAAFTVAAESDSVSGVSAGLGLNYVITGESDGTSSVTSSLSTGVEQEHSDGHSTVGGTLTVTAPLDMSGTDPLSVGTYEQVLSLGGVIHLDSPLLFA